MLSHSLVGSRINNNSWYIDYWTYAHHNKLSRPDNKNTTMKALRKPKVKCVQLIFPVSLWQPIHWYCDVYGTHNVSHLHALLCSRTQQTARCTTSYASVNDLVRNCTLILIIINKCCFVQVQWAGRLKTTQSWSED